MGHLNILFIGLGGALGALSRYLVSGWVTNRFQHFFPYGTLVVNITGCFLLGFFYSYTLERNVLHDYLRVFITIGFLGAFTTFSTFSLEILNLIKSNNLKTALIYIGVSVIIGLFAVWLGASLEKYI
ncbi:MAG: fluoride efflux transporter CrcB [Bacillota bacterium]